ncbi:MAG: hypothetical protein PHD81_01215 [Candidatus Nanoarchaeia archaeon]|nr:hypothetical protein [Candidatus Nanoarchaeia archaeon]MDD5587710.1 hypothetical protein [Candidatus Nanoarchaeia archaeon]
MVKEVKTLLVVLFFAVLGLFLFDILSSFNSQDNLRTLEATNVISEKVTCKFSNTLNSKTCKGLDASNIQLATCTGKTSCLTSVTGRKGAAITWSVLPYTYINAKGAKYTETCSPAVKKNLDGIGKTITFSCVNKLISAPTSGGASNCAIFSCSTPCTKTCNSCSYTSCYNCCSNIKKS